MSKLNENVHKMYLCGLITTFHFWFQIVSKFMKFQNLLEICIIILKFNFVSKFDLFLKRVHLVFK